MNTILLDLPVPIITPRLILRPPRIGDGAMLNEAILETFDVLNKYMLWAKEKPSLEESEMIIRKEAANWIYKRKEDPELMLLIVDKKTNEFIGATGFHSIDWDVPCLETGYWVRKIHAGKGFITEAINAITQYAFKVIMVKRIAITCDVDNERSKRIPEKLGFHLEGILKASRIKPDTGMVSDTLVFARYDLSNLPKLTVNWEGHQ